MKLRHTLSADELERGFDTSSDIFQLKDLADRVTALFENMQGGSVCLLDGRWGTGKSTFVKQWSAELTKSSIANIYFDAFASDYIDTPFTALAGMFVKASHDARISRDPEFHNFLNKASKVGKALAATSAKVALKAATLGVMDGSEIEGLADAIADGLGEIAESSVKRLLEEHAERESQFLAMRDAFAKLTVSLRSKMDGAENNSLVVFIDELDRCRPDFALGILEILKHFFNVDGVHFVLVTSKSYLESAVNGKYGFGSLSGEYLEKFYDFVVLFDVSHERHSAGSISPFIDQTLDRFIPDRNQDDYDFKQAVSQVCMAYRLTLRQVENVCINSCIAYLSVKGRNILKPASLIALLSAMKALDLEMYRKARTGKLTWEEAVSFIDLGDWSESYRERFGNVVRWHLDPNIDENSEEWNDFGRGMWTYNIGRLDMFKYISNSIVDRFARSD